MTKRYSTYGQDRVYAAMCELAEEVDTTRSLACVAQKLKVSRQYVSEMTRWLVLAGRIEWVDRNTYRIVGSDLFVPDD